MTGSQIMTEQEIRELLAMLRANCAATRNPSLAIGYAGGISALEMVLGE